jgi:hypothetical protein
MVGCIWDDGVRVCWFSEYGYVYEVVTSRNSDVLVVNFIILLCFVSELYIRVYGVEVTCDGVDVGV